MKKLNLKVTDDRVANVDLETFYFLESSPKSMIDFVAHFVTDEEGNYLEGKEAVKVVVAGRKIEDIEEIVSQLQKAMEDQAVPKA